jgi:hypothetical protein
VPDHPPWQIAQPHPADLDAPEAEHVRSDCTEQAPNLAVPALAQDHFEPSVARTGTEHPRRFRQEAFAVEHHACLNPLQHVLVRHAADLDVVDLLDERLMRWVAWGLLLLGTAAGLWEHWPG